ncbi:MAG: methyltransferase domain-containing protein [Acidiferrobacterales bacterium]|nr:methyltransferase domain-containing protein [Acidiferrobacterales bacterium]
MDIDAKENSYDVVICSQVYEHVPDASKMMSEIYRVLKPGGVCYFAAGNRLMWNEPHYNLPLLSVIPKFLAHYYVRFAGRGKEYYETHFTLWGLRSLVHQFQIIDFTRPIIHSPEKYAAQYMMQPGTTKARVAKLMARYIYWLVPCYVWLLKK